MTTSVVTGAFGYSGKYIARRLIAAGEHVITLTNHSPAVSPNGPLLTVAPLQFDNPAALAESMRGAHTLYNTYWIRFEKGCQTHDLAVRNTLTLISAAKAAGVRRIIHTSITNPSLTSPLPYFRGKALLEQAIQESGLDYTILRPAVLFGNEDILMNNIAFFLRRFPIFAIPGSGNYRLQPVFVEDFADLAVAAGGNTSNEVLDAAGPEIFTFCDLTATIREAIGSRTRLFHLPAGLALACARTLGVFVRDVVMTRDELTGLMADVLVSAQPPLGRTRFSQWLCNNATTIGLRYASELARHYRTGQTSMSATSVNAFVGVA